MGKKKRKKGLAKRNVCNAVRMVRTWWSGTQGVLRVGAAWGSA